jgi:Flagellar hook-length control protein FliK
MQSALAIIPYPLATVETPPISVEPTDQGFALAFDEGLISPEGETVTLDSISIGPWLSPIWVGPALSIPALVPSEMEDGGTADLLDTESVASSGTDPSAPDLLRLFAGLGGPDLVAEEAPEKLTSAILASSEEGVTPGLSGKITAELAGMASEIALHPDPTLDAMLEQTSAGSLPTKAPAPHLPLQQARDAEVDATPGLPSVGGDAAETEMAPASLVDSRLVENATRATLLRSGSSDRADTPKEDQGARSEPSIANSEQFGRTIERSDFGGQVRVEFESPNGHGTGQAPLHSIVDEHEDGASERDFTLQPADPSRSQTQPASFWERAFAGMTAPWAATGLQADQSAGSGSVVIPAGVVKAMTAVDLPMGTSETLIDPPTVAFPPDRLDMSALGELPAKAPLSLVAVESPPLSPKQTGSIPLILISEWDQRVLEAREQLDLALLSGPVLQSGSNSSGAPGPQSPLSLPIQQVAAQLAGVLVDVSHKATELALAPEELGRVHLRLEPDATNPDRMTILINVERQETLDLFRRHAGELAEAIKAAGYSGADIGFGQEGQGSSPDQKPKQNTFGSGRPPEDQAPVSLARHDGVGSTLDLRL